MLPSEPAHGRLVRVQQVHCSFFDHPPPSLPRAPRYRVARDHRLYTNDVAYREALKPGAVRIDLNGEPAGVVTPGQIPPPRSKPKAKHASHSPAPPAPAPKRLSLTDLKAAAVARRKEKEPHE